MDEHGNLAGAMKARLPVLAAVLVVACGGAFQLGCGGGAQSDHDGGPGGAAGTMGGAGTAGGAAGVAGGAMGAAGATGAGGGPGGVTGAAGASGGATGTGGSPMPSPFAGQWVGTTSQNQPIALNVTSDGTVDAILMGVRMSLSAGTCTTIMSMPMSTAAAAISAGSFSAAVADTPTGGTVSSTVAGAFSGTQAQGTFSGFSGGYLVLCGSTLELGTGSLFASGTWTAVPGSVSCPSANDGKCDEPALCLKGTDTADCAGTTTGSGSWKPTTTTGAPTARQFHAAVWTGQEMIIWGGRSSSAADTDSGARYSPTSDKWVPTSAVGAPTAREGMAAVWTGREMIVWGGVGPDITTALATGGRYDPTSDTWRALATAGAPSARSAGNAVWTGQEMIVWGGYQGANLGDGARYNPETDVWTPMSTAGAPLPRHNHDAIWTGTELIIWGGATASSTSGTNTGARYNPATDSWAAMSTANAPSGRYSAGAVWTGTEMIAFGGYAGSPTATGGRYAPDTDTWSALPTAGAPTARVNPSSIWTGREAVFWGDDWPLLSGFVNTGGKLDPSNGTWSATVTAGAPAPRRNQSAIWTGSEIIVWGGYDGSRLQTGGRYTP